MRSLPKLFPLLLSTACILPIAAVVVRGAPGTKQAHATPGTAVKLPEVCGVQLAEPQISPSLPNDVEGALRQKDRNVAQRASNIFSWQEFVALNWPARKGQRGEADPGRRIGEAGARVWETWKETREVYLPGGAPPPEWNTPPPAIAGGRGNVPPEARQSAHLLTSTLQAVQSDGTLPATLTDRQGHVVRYEVRMNRVLFDFIRTNGLYDGRKQATTDSVSFPNGSMLIKAAWRELEPGEASRFLTTEAWIYDLQAGKPVHWRRKTMGLVGFHIVRKTPSAPQWVWSTFEQIDNLAGAHPSFRTGSGAKEAVNRQTHPGVPNLVQRTLPIPARQPDCSRPTAAVDNVQALNRAIQQALDRQRSVLRHYELIDTQWPLPPEEPNAATPTTVFRTLPAVLGNTTMETFAQDTSSCMGCHAMARTRRTDRFVGSDFTFTLSNAQPELPNTQTLPPPLHPTTDWDRQNWASILRGKELTEHTYELLPKHVTAKLHCESCHLDAGRDPDSAWWVNMNIKYPTLEKLQARVNQCFERSMNGTPLPTVQSASELPKGSPEMNAFLIYMQWMDEQYKARSSTPPHQGLYPVAKMTGEATRGEEIFLQKCASCHGKEGKGKYESHTYYRPALWGEHSFNSLAGMHKPEKLVAFLKSNMPYRSGGVLTPQESWDLTAFLITRPRPKK